MIVRLFILFFFPHPEYLSIYRYGQIDGDWRPNNAKREPGFSSENSMDSSRVLPWVLFLVSISSFFFLLF